MTLLSWTDERIATLTELWASGLSASEIGRAMGGITRNSVISKVHREGLPSRPREVAIQNSIRNAPRGPRRSAAPRQPRPSRAKSDNGGFTAVNAERRRVAPLGPDLEAVKAVHPVPSTARPWFTRVWGQCAFPVAGEGNDTLSCCGRTDGGPYCPTHREQMYKPAATPQQRAHMARMRAARRKAA